MSANLRRKSSSASGNGTAKAAAATAATTTPATGTVVSAPPTNGNGKPKSTRAVSLTKHKVDANAFEKLPADPTPQELRSAAINVSLADLEDRVADVRDSWETDSLFEDVIDSLTEDPAQVAARKSGTLLLLLLLLLPLLLIPLLLSLRSTSTIILTPQKSPHHVICIPLVLAFCFVFWASR